jgi:hypothetical protein
VFLDKEGINKNIIEKFIFENMYESVENSFLCVLRLLAFLGLERLCACTSDGTLHFFITVEEEDSTEEKEDVDDVNMGSEDSCINENTAPSTSSSSSPQ